MSSRPFLRGRSEEGRRLARAELRPEDVPATPVSLRRVGRLFAPYRVRLGGLLGLIFTSAGLGVISPFLLRGVLDKAIPHRDTTLLTLLVGGMIALSILTSVIGVAQTWVSNQVGQRVMHDLRSAVYRHLQRMSLAFFTHTRTGEVQSRIANDIGGIDSVVTSTATSIVQNVTTVVAVIIAMILLDWRLAAFSLVLLPFFVTAVVVTVRHNRIPCSAQGLQGHRWWRSRNRASICSRQKGRYSGRTPITAGAHGAHRPILAWSP